MSEAKAVRKGETAGSRTRSIAFVALTIALLAVSAWVSIPLGPVPFTLQTFVVVFAILVLTPAECFATLGGYLVLGGIGLPLFSSMRGGIGMLAGPTGGFLWGFLLGAAAAMLVRRPLAAALGDGKTREFVANLVTAIVFLLVTYVCGWVQLMIVGAMGPAPAFAAAIAPFILPDAVKLVAAVLCAQAVAKALPNR